MRYEVEIAQLIAAGLAAIFFMVAALVRVHYDLDRIVDGMQTVARWNTAASVAGAGVFACQMILFFIPA